MALQIWLPLDGELRNKGLNNGTTIIQNGGDPVYENGKTGLSLVCNGSKNWRISGVTLGTNVTIAWWSKTSVNGKMSWVLESDASSLLNLYENSIYTLNTGDGNSNTFKTSANANINVLHDGKWHHFAVVFDASSVLLYIDGEYKGKATTYRNPSTTNKILKLAGDYQRAHSYDWNGSLADFRVYDDTLTAQDVRELYFGKVLEVTPQWRDEDRIMDASGFNFPLTPHNLTVTGNTILFNGSSSDIQFNGLKLTGGTVSIWANLPAKPTVQRIYYCDPTSKMVIGYLAGGTILTAANGTSKASYQSTGITWGQMHHIVAVYGTDRFPSAFYVNGVQPATGTQSTWTNSGDIASIGRRISAGAGNDFISGSVAEVKVFASQLTAEDAMALYKAGPNPSVWGEIYPNIDLPNWEGMYMTYSGCTWVKVLHHNNPSANLFTTGNCKNNTSSNLFSRLYLFDDTDRFKMTDGRYEFMVREKINSNSTENIGMWVQTSSPTAGTVAGYKQLYKSTAVSRDFGLVHQTTRTHFDNKASWWCACGSYTAYEGGTPGFWGTVKTGYIDLYIRVDNTPFFNKPL